jgi:predicted nicotinamide N-methyase
MLEKMGAEAGARVVGAEAGTAAAARSETAWAGLRQVTVPFVAEVTLATADAPWELWDASGRDAPPFWAFPWAGGQALARYVLDNPQVVRGKRVLDVASGSGLVAIAAAKAGAASVMATDIDPDSLAAIAGNAAANGVIVQASHLDMECAAARGNARGDAWGAEVVLAADVFYQRELAATALAFLRAAATTGGDVLAADVLAADPGRAFVPKDRLTPVAAYEIPVLTVIEDVAVKTVTVYRLADRRR